MKYISEKTMKIFHSLCVFIRPTWGIHTKNVRTIYLQVIVPIVTYAAGVWGHVASKKYVKKSLEGMQRLFAIRAIRGFRTISTVAALVLARFPPLALKVLEVYKIENTRLTGVTPTLPDDDCLNSAPHLKNSFLHQTGSASTLTWW